MSFGPRTGEAEADTSDSELDAICDAAERSFVELEYIGRFGRARMLRGMVSALEERRDLLIEVADRESALGWTRLDNELTRTQYQLNLFAEVIEEGSYLEATIDHAGPTPMGQRPDLRRILRALGPIAVFGASNFPFAFSVPGGDSASALAAGCPVIAKVHPLHPSTSLLACEALVAGAHAAGLGTEPMFLVSGQEAGARLVRHRTVQAVGFTGSTEAGARLHAVASSRPSPIPFYGELGALNAFVVCPAAVEARAADIAAGLVASFTLGVGQFCTKPGLVFVPAGRFGSGFLEELVTLVSASPVGQMVGASISSRFEARAAAIADLPNVTIVSSGAADGRSGIIGGMPTLVLAAPSAVEGVLLEECFGPMLVATMYEDASELLERLKLLRPALTATVHADADDEYVARSLVDLFTKRVGRIVWNGYPTGVAVSWAMHHGGPYPATTNALHSSVGATSIRRWLRPVSYQDVPARFLPRELRDDSEMSPVPVRRIDGRLIVPGKSVPI